MKPESQRIAIAEACGWVDIQPCTCATQPRGHRSQSSELEHLPDYLNDLNAMREAEKMLVSQDQKIEYLEQLYVLNFKGDQNPDTFIEQVFSTAAQRAEAFLKTMNLWKE